MFKIFKTKDPEPKVLIEDGKTHISPDGRVQYKITNTAPPEEENFDALMPEQPTTDIASYLKNTKRVPYV